MKLTSASQALLLTSLSHGKQFRYMCCRSCLAIPILCLCLEQIFVIYKKSQQITSEKHFQYAMKYFLGDVFSLNWLVAYFLFNRLYCQGLF